MERCIKNMYQVIILSVYKTQNICRQSINLNLSSMKSEQTLFTDEDCEMWLKASQKTYRCTFYFDNLLSKK